jgi:diaminopimelate decarboxylase
MTGGSLSPALRASPDAPETTPGTTPGAPSPRPADLPHAPGRGDLLRDDRIGGIEMAELARRFGTPLYVYDLDLVGRRVAALRAALPGSVELAYAVKANPSLAVVAHIGALGVGADVASGGELATVLRAGIAPDHVVVTGPGKRDDELAAAVAAGVRAVTVEGPGELERLERLAAAAGRRVPVLLRASIGASAPTERLRMVGDGGAGKFGMGEDDLRSAARHSGASRHLELLGVHRFGASNVLDPAILAAHVAETVEIGRSVASRARMPLRLVDAGGGLGIPYDPQDEELDLADLGRLLASLADGWAADQATRAMRVLLEPGRFLVGPAGVYVARVVDRKAGRDTEVAILDGGVHHLLRPALVGQEHQVRVLGTRARGRPGRPVTVAGPLCSGLDVFAASATLPVPEPGDLVAVLDAGAYGFTEAMPFFLSHPIPAEVAVRGGRAALIRPRHAPEEWLARQVVPDWQASGFSGETRGVR